MLFTGTFSFQQNHNILIKTLTICLQNFLMPNDTLTATVVNNHPLKSVTSSKSYWQCHDLLGVLRKYSCLNNHHSWSCDWFEVSKIWPFIELPGFNAHCKNTDDGYRLISVLFKLLVWS